MRPLLFALVALSLGAGSARAAPIDDLFEALRLGDTLAIIRAEGLDHAAEIEADMFPGRGGTVWNEMADDLYGLDRMDATIRDGFAARLGTDQVAPLLDFFTSDAGARIIDMEIEARRAIMDDGVEAAAQERAGELREAGGERFGQIDAFVAANDLIDQNVAGAMNSTLAFLSGLAATGAYGEDFSEAAILRDVWAQEPEIRVETRDWVYGYLTLAYQPIPPGDLDAYIALSRTEAGQALNAALFGAFDDLLTGISGDLGTRAGAFLEGEDI